MPNVKNKVRLCTTSPMSIFIVENVGGTPFYNRRNDFERLLDKYVTNPRYKNFFAMPYFESALHGLEWHVDPEFAYAVKLSTIAGTEQYENAKRFIAEATSYYRSLIGQASEHEQQYLKCLIKHIDSTDIDEMAFVTDNQVILGVWGIKVMPGQSMNAAVVTDVDDNRLHRVSFTTSNATLRGTASFMRRHGYKLHPGIDVPQVIPEEGYKFVSWMPFDPNNVQVNEDLHFVAKCEEIITPPPYVPPVVEPVLESEPEPVPEPEPEPPIELCTVNFEGGENGTLSGAPSTIKVPVGSILSTSMIPAVSPLEGFTFLGWDKATDRPITSDITYFAVYDKKPLPWWKRWFEDGCLRWLLLALLTLLLLLILAIVLTRCTSCSGKFGDKIHEWHDDIVGVDDDSSDRHYSQIRDGGRSIERIRTRDGRGYIDDNGNRTPRDITEDEGWAEGDDVIPGLIDDNGDLISGRGRLDPNDPNSPEVLDDRLNIFFDNDNPDFEKFATEFKRNYPGDQYKIIGKDKNTRWLLVQVPPEERPRIRDELPSKIPSMKFKVVDEVLMAGGQMPDSRSNMRKGWHLDAARIKQAWDVTTGSQDVTVAVVDDGIDINHEMFAGRISKPYNVFRCDDHLSSGVGHGTHVAGLAAGSRAKVGQGTAGVAPNCKIMPIQVFDNGQCTISGVIRGIMYAIRNNADVVNVSIGTAYPPQLGQIVPIEEQKEVARSYYKPAEDVWKWVFEQAGKKNTIIVFAAGNSHLLAGMQPQLRSRSTINVGAIGDNNTMTNFSNFGNTVYVTAPGEGIYSSVPGNRYQSLDGTSMSAPIVTGVVALMKSVKKSVNVSEALSALISTGVSIRNGNESGPAIQADKAVNKVKQG